MIGFMTGEFFLRRRPNGGTVVLLRSVWVSLLIYSAALGARESIAPNHRWMLDLDRLRTLVAETIPWFGAILAASYAAFYTRFASQWTYLAEVYNQFMAVAAQLDWANEKACEALDTWEAGFVEDAEELHLATKPMFASVIRSLLDKPGVRKAYVASTSGGEPRLLCLSAKVDGVLKLEERRWQRDQR